MQNSTTFEKVLSLALVVLIGIAFGTFLIKGWEKQEIVDCNSWIEQSEKFPNYFITKWQDDQCRAHGIVINTTVIGN